MGSAKRRVKKEERVGKRNVERLRETEGETEGEIGEREREKVHLFIQQLDC